MTDIYLRGKFLMRADYLQECQNVDLTMRDRIAHGIQRVNDIHLKGKVTKVNVMRQLKGSFKQLNALNMITGTDTLHEISQNLCNLTDFGWLAAEFALFFGLCGVVHLYYGSVFGLGLLSTKGLSTLQLGGVRTIWKFLEETIEGRLSAKGLRHMQHMSELNPSGVLESTEAMHALVSTLTTCAPLCVNVSSKRTEVSVFIWKVHSFLTFHAKLLEINDANLLSLALVYKILTRPPKYMIDFSVCAGIRAQIPTIESEEERAQCFGDVIDKFEKFDYAKTVMQKAIKFDGTVVLHELIGVLNYTGVKCLESLLTSIDSGWVGWKTAGISKGDLDVVWVLLQKRQKEIPGLFGARGFFEAVHRWWMNDQDSKGIWDVGSVWNSVMLGVGYVKGKVGNLKVNVRESFDSYYSDVNNKDSAGTYLREMSMLCNCMSPGGIAMLQPNKLKSFLDDSVEGLMHELTDPEEAFRTAVQAGLTYSGTHVITEHIYSHATGSGIYQTIKEGLTRKGMEIGYQETFAPIKSFSIPGISLVSQHGSTGGHGGGGGQIGQQKGISLVGNGNEYRNERMLHRGIVGKSLEKWAPVNFKERLRRDKKINEYNNVE